MPIGRQAKIKNQKPKIDASGHKPMPSRDEQSLSVLLDGACAKNSPYVPVRRGTPRYCCVPGGTFWYVDVRGGTVGCVFAQRVGVRRRLRFAAVEVLVPDFQLNASAIDTVLAAGRTQHLRWDRALRSLEAGIYDTVQVSAGDADVGVGGTVVKLHLAAVFEDHATREHDVADVTDPLIVFARAEHRSHTSPDYLCGVVLVEHYGPGAIDGPRGGHPHAVVYLQPPTLGQNRWDGGADPMRIPVAGPT